MEQEKLAFVDALRGFAVLAVILSHTPLPESMARLNFIGAYGVQLFFVVSAFTLFLSMRNRSGTEKNPVTNFFIRRFFRIAPAFYAAAAFYLWKDGIAASPQAPEGIKLWHVLTTLSFTHGWHPESINLVVPGGWSIAVEMTFYLFVPLAYALVTSVERAALLSFGLLVIGVVANRLLAPYATAAYPPGESALATYFLQLWFVSQACVFPLGFLLFQLVVDRQRVASVGQPAAIALVAITVYLCVAFSSGGYALIPAHYMFGAAFVIFGLALAAHPFRLLVNAVTRHVGKVSFSVYLLHFWAISLVKSALGPAFSNADPRIWGVVCYVATTVLAVLAATLSFHFLERPGQALGSRLIRKLEAS